MKEYTLYDSHMHVSSENPDHAIQILDACDIAKAVILNKGYGKQRPNLEHEMWERVGFDILERYADRFVVFSTVDFSRMDEPDFASHAAAHFEDTVGRGASGLKLWLGKPDHHWMALDDPRIGAVYEKAAELLVPVLIHVGDPADFWKAEVPPDSLWYEIARQNRGWSYYGRPVPAREELFAEQRSMLSRYPETTFICPHVGGHAENLEYLGSLLDKHPNLFVDTTAYESVLSKAPHRAKAFMIKYQDRIMVGTDNGWVTLELETLAKRTRTKRLFYETDIQQRDLVDYLAPFPRKPGCLQGINLPTTVLHKIYRENAARLIPGLASSTQPRAAKDPLPSLPEVG